jgi:hypothetical protein
MANSTPDSSARETASAVDNIRRWDGKKRGHYEVWYLTFNHLASQTGYWIRYTLESPLEGHEDPYAQLWFAHFDARDPARTFAINRVFPIDSLRAAADPFSVAIDTAELTHGGARGQLAGAGHHARWDLSWRPAAATHRQLPRVMYRGDGVGDTTVLTPNLDVALRGTVEVDGRRYTLDGDPGGQTHLWGKKHAHAWAWGHSNGFEGRPGAAFETLTVRLKKRGLVLPPLTILCLHLDGEVFRWSEFQHTPFTRGHFGTAHYGFRALGARVRLEGEFTCRPEEMVVAEYHDPDGEPSFCANTEIADLRITVEQRDGLFGRFRERARLVAPRTGHFEVGGRDRDPAVTRSHQTVR